MRLPILRKLNSGVDVLGALNVPSPNIVIHDSLTHECDCPCDLTIHDRPTVFSMFDFGSGCGVKINGSTHYWNDPRYDNFTLYCVEIIESNTVAFMEEGEDIDYPIEIVPFNYGSPRPSNILVVGNMKEQRPRSYLQFYTGIYNYDNTIENLVFTHVDRGGGAALCNHTWDEYTEADTQLYTIVIC